MQRSIYLIDYWIELTVNTPSCCKIFLWIKLANSMHMICWSCYQNSIGQRLIKFHVSSSPREPSGDLFSTGSKRNSTIFEDLKAHLIDFSIFFHEYCLIARSYCVLVVDINSLIVSALVAFPLLATFWRFLTFYELFV